MIKINNFRGHDLRIAAAVVTFLLLSEGAGAVSDMSGNRIWDDSKNMNTTYTWNSFSFAGFYYNLDDNLSTEELTIHNINNITRKIKESDLRYKTLPAEVSFDYSPFGNYEVIGFMADKYFAGYTAKSVISGNKMISTIGSAQLHRVLLDEEDKHLVFEGGTLTLNEGYVLNVKQVDIGGGPRQVWVSLLKDGVEVDSSVVGAGNTYTYLKKVGSVSDLPIIAVHVDSVFRGGEENVAFIKGLFQISDSFTRVESGDRYGVMEITEISNNVISMDNRNTLDLSPGKTIDLMGNLKIIVADKSSVLRFALSAERAGTFEVRGTIYPVTDKWTPLNFGLNIGGTSTGFFYDMDNGVGTENLRINSISGASIPGGNLIYSTSPREISFDYAPFGSYHLIGFMADKYFAGYSEKSAISRNKKISVIESGQLQKVLLDDKEKRVAVEGGTITLKEGYVLKINSVDVGAGTGQLWIVLLKDGMQVDDAVVAGGNTYTYIKKVGSVSDLPIIAVYFESVFRGREMNAAFTEGVFQISEKITSVKSGDHYGNMEISSVDINGIEMDNPNSIGLSPGSTVDMMGNIKFKVADDPARVRFYPFVPVTPGMMANQLAIDAPAKATAGDVIRVRVTAGGNTVEGATVTIGADSGRSDMNGILNYILPRTLKGISNITASKLGYEKAVKSMEVQGYIENMLSIDTPVNANQFETITILVTYNGTPVDRANITFDNMTIGLTGSNGALNYMPEKSGTHTISASKSGYITAARDIRVRIPFSEFEAMDINITPDPVSTGKMIFVRSNITNTGTKKDTLPVALIINNTEVDNRSVTLAPGEINMIEFTHKVSLPAGNYTIEILRQKRSIQVVKGAPFIEVLTVIMVIFFCSLLLRKKQK
jgi:S-layer protein (TIGR01567 family)